jgi:hypothetical protein
MAIEDKSEMNLVFESSYKKHFQFVKELEYQKVLVLATSSEEVVFQRKEKHYSLSKDLLQEEFLAFYRFMMYEFRQMYQEDRRNMDSDAFESELLEEFLRNLEDLNCRGFETRCVEALEKMSNNYFLHFESISPQYVYEGYPLPTNYHSSMKVLCLLHSSEKMNSHPQETFAFQNFTNYIKEKAARFKIAQYLFMAGY